MIKGFAPLETVDLQTMSSLIDSMMDLLEAIDEGLIPNEFEYTLSDLTGYLDSLVRGQRNSLGRTVPGSWALVPNDHEMPSDARVEFIFRPTYIATATLCRALCEFPLVPIQIPGYFEALLKGMHFCSLRGLKGHGYDAEEGAIEAMQILSLGKVPWILKRHPEASPDLKRIIDEVADEMAHRLLDGSAVGVWGEDYSEGFRSALETLRLKNDPDFMSSLSEAQRDPSTLSKDELPW